MKKILAVFALISFLSILSGCAGIGAIDDDTDSLKKAGVSKVDTEKVILEEGETIGGTEYHVTLGKEYGSFNVDIEFDEQGVPKHVKIAAQDVDAFVGQQAAAKAFTDVQNDLKELGVSLGDNATSALKESIYKLFVPPE